MADITAKTAASTFVSGWIARFGVLTSITTDHGRQFESALWEQLTCLLGSNRFTQLPTILLPMGWWKGFTAS